MNNDTKQALETVKTGIVKSVGILLKEQSKQSKQSMEKKTKESNISKLKVELKDLKENIISLSAWITDVKNNKNELEAVRDMLSKNLETMSKIIEKLQTPPKK
jgi:predicted  nucleic acid-binding Zn-ribbon protein